MTPLNTAPDPASAASPQHSLQRWPHRWRQGCSAWLPDLVAFSVSLLCAGLAALVIGLIGGCGGGVGTEGTGSYASGPITGFGSIIVNGVHFDDGAAQLQDDDGKGLASDSLALGMVVQVTAGPISAAADGRLRAQASAVHTDRALVGPASAVDRLAGSLRVLGQPVLVSADTVFDARLVGGLAGVGGVGGLAPGQLLEVYGFFDSRRAAYAATRIAPAAASAGYRVSGQVASVDARNQTFTLGSQTYSYASLASSSAPVPGTVLRLQLKSEPDAGGRWQVSDQRSTDSAPQDRDGAGLDGRVSALLSAGRFVVDGVTVDASAAQVSGSLKLGAQVTVRGTLRAGLLLATQVVVGSDEQARSFDLSGNIGSLDTTARRFVLRGTPVSYGRADLVFENGNAAKLVGYAGTLEVEGQLSADRTQVDAQRIRFDH